MFKRLISVCQREVGALGRAIAVARDLSTPMTGLLGVRAERVGQLRVLAAAILVLAVGGNAALWGYETYRVGIHTDLASFLTFAYLGVHSGWSHLYDWHLTKPLLHLYGARYWPNQYPPPPFWVVMPFLSVPWPAMYVIWVVIQAVAMLSATLLLAPRESRWWHVLLVAALPPVGLSLWLGQMVPLVVLGVALAWRLIEAKRDLLAGAALCLLVLKPNLALLVPVALLAGARWRLVLGAGAVALVMVAVSAWTLTPYGIEQYFAHLRDVTASQPAGLVDRSTTLSGLFGFSPLLLPVDALVVAAVAWVAFRTRRDSPALVLSAGIVGSLLVTTYLHWQDLAMLIPAYWLWIKASPQNRYVRWAGVPIWIVAAAGAGAPVLLLVWLVTLVAGTTSVSRLRLWPRAATTSQSWVAAPAATPPPSAPRS